MTVANHPTRNQYVATAGQTVFSYIFEITAAVDLRVYKRPGTDAPDDVADLLTLTTDYTVTAINQENGSTITLIAPAALGDIITIESGIPVERDTSFTPNGLIQAQDLNIEFDNQTLIEQRFQTQANYRVPTYRASAIISTKDLELPILNAKESWVMNEDNTEIINYIAITEEDAGSHLAGKGASLIGLQDQSNVTNKNVQDLANAQFIVNVNNGSLQNAQSMGDLSTGVVLNTQSSGVLSISVPLTSIQNLATDVDTMIYTTSSNVYATTVITNIARQLIDDTTFADMRTTLGLVIGQDVQAYSPTLTSIAPLGTATNKYLYTTALNTWTEGNISPLAISLLADTTQAQMQSTIGVDPTGLAFLIANNLSEGVPATIRTNIDVDQAGTNFRISNNLSEGVLLTKQQNLGLEIGVDVQAHGDGLDSISGLGTAAGKMLYSTGVDTWAETTLTPYMRTVLDDPSAATAAATLGVLPLAGGTMTGPLLLYGNPSVGVEAVTLSYLNSRLENIEEACLAMDDNVSGYTYNNGVSGVGATLTASGVGVYTVDGITPALGERILVNKASNQAENGAYTVTTSSVGTLAVLTRATDYDAAPDMQAGDAFTVVQGTLYGGSQWVMSQTNPVTVGTTPITFTQVAGLGALLKANNLNDLTNAATARINLGLVIGTNVQAQDPTLQSLSTLGSGANRYAYTTGVDTWTEGVITSFGRSLIDDADNTAARITLGVVIGTDVQAYSSNLSVAAFPTNGATLVSTNTGTAVWSGTMTNGQVIMGVSGGTPVKNTLTQGANILITNGAGTITIASTASGSVADVFLLMGG